MKSSAKNPNNDAYVLVHTPWHMGTHLRVLSGSYLKNTNMKGFEWFSIIFFVLVLWTKATPALERLTTSVSQTWTDRRSIANLCSIVDIISSFGWEIPSASYCGNRRAFPGRVRESDFLERLNSWVSAVARVIVCFVSNKPWYYPTVRLTGTLCVEISPQKIYFRGMGFYLRQKEPLRH